MAVRYQLVRLTSIRSLRIAVGSVQPPLAWMSRSAAAQRLSKLGATLVATGDP